MRAARQLSQRTPPTRAPLSHKVSSERWNARIADRHGYLPQQHRAGPTAFRSCRIAVCSTFPRGDLAIARAVKCTDRRPAPLLATAIGQRRNQTQQLRYYSTKPTSEVLTNVLRESQEQLFHEEQKFLLSLANTVKEIGGADEDVCALQVAAEQLRDPFLLVVVGEFNSGKSTMLNAMLGSKFLAEGVTPTTSSVNILRYGQSVSQKNVRNLAGAEEKDQLEVLLPVDWLKQISLVDTPGTNAVITAHQQITEHFVSRADMVLFVTSCDRPFTESERAFLDKIKAYQKKVIIVLSKIDILDEEHELQQIIEWLKEQSRKFLDIDPLIFPVSAKKALKAKLSTSGGNPLHSNPQWKDSRFGSLETYILKSLSAEDKAQLKLQNPLGISEHIIKKYENELAERQKTIQADMQILERIDYELESYKADMIKDFQYHLDRIDNILLRMVERGTLFLDSKLALSNILELMKTDALKVEFEQKVVGDTSSEIDRSISDVVDWMVDKYTRVWNNIVEYTHRQAIVYEKQVVGSLRTQYVYNRHALLARLGDSAKTVVAGFDRHAEAQKLTNEMRAAIYSTAVMHLGAVGVGTLIALSVLDVTGLLGVGSLAAFGVGILPYKRRQMKAAFSDRVTELRTTLQRTLRDHFETELEKGLQDIKTNIAPYTHFVKKEAEQLAVAKAKLAEAKSRIRELADKVEHEFKATH